eukprot:scaffold120831_cov68-Phaeocystis_antarctica.AAC.3
MDGGSWYCLEDVPCGVVKNIFHAKFRSGGCSRGCVHPTHRTRECEESRLLTGKGHRLSIDRGARPPLTGDTSQGSKEIPLFYSQP